MCDTEPSTNPLGENWGQIESISNSNSSNNNSNTTIATTTALEFAVKEAVGAPLWLPWGMRPLHRSRRALGAGHCLARPFYP